jgi:DUF2075 family protein
MILYESTIESFNEDVMQNCIADRAAEKYQAHYKRAPNPSEYRSWAISLAILNYSFRYADLKDNYILVEYELPYSSRRIDVMLFGNDIKGGENVVILELKQWSNDKVRDAKNSEGNVIVDSGRRGLSEVPHPSLQVEGYFFHLKDFKEIFSEKNAPELSAATYAHNYSKLNKNRVLYLEKFADAIKRFPIFSKEDSLELARYLKERLNGGKGRLLFERFNASRIRPSRRLIEHTSEMINKQQIFHLIDDQIAAYNAIMHKVKLLAKTKQKSVVIVKGGPGTGKSVIALELMGELLRMGKKVMHASGSAAFANTLRDIVGKRARILFNFFFSYTKAEDNSIDVLICDEAHRIRKDSNDWGVPAQFKSKSPQVDDLIRPAKISVFFIDEYQVVRPKEQGSVELIKSSAKKLGIRDDDILEFELKTQFRCSGSDAYLQWLDHVLDIRETEITEFDAKMEFRIFDSPSAMREEIRKRNMKKPNSSRIVAGFCWPWSKPNPDGTLVNDVKIGDFEMPWENKREFWKFATYESGMDQVGTVYTVQGMEFDYIGVIFGNDLIYDPNEKKWKAIPENSHDKEVKRNNPNLVNHLKNTYRVLLSRGMKGVYVYFMDKNTEKYFRSHLLEVK